MRQFITAVYAGCIRPVRAGVLVLALALCAPSLRADIPRVIPFQGVLGDASGKPKPNGTYNLTFKLYDAPGNLIWGEVNKPVQVTGGKGQFMTSLGSDTPLTGVAFDRPYFLEIQVQGEAAPMTPRLPLASVPYAFASGAASLTLPFTGSASVASPGAALSVTNTGSGASILGQGAAATGVAGKSSSGSGTTGESDAWIGVYGESGSNTGVWGHGLSGNGVYGSSDGSGIGVFGESASFEGVRGVSHNVNSGGVVAYNVANGVASYGNSVGGTGMFGTSKTGIGVYGESVSNGQGTGNHGVYGKATVPYAAGVYGTNAAGLGWGLYGDEQGPGGAGVVGTASGSAASVGVFGSTLTGYGIEGQGNGSGAVGVRGQNSSGAYGELGSYSNIGGSIGVLAVGPSSGSGNALYTIGGATIDGLIVSGDSFINGNERIHHDLVVDGNKQFLIDHPLDPANKTLAHSCAEGPEPLDLYNGNVTTDANGVAVVQLPDYFEALNRDFRYQLTCIGQFAQAIVAEKIKDNHFTIRTDKPNVEVSWLVTGVRNDAYMKAHPMKVEELKPESQRGKYLDPESYGLPADRGITPPHPGALAQTASR